MQKKIIAEIITTTDAERFLNDTSIPLPNEEIKDVLPPQGAIKYELNVRPLIIITEMNKHGISRTASQIMEPGHILFIMEVLMCLIPTSSKL